MIIPSRGLPHPPSEDTLSSCVGLIHENRHQNSEKWMEVNILSKYISDKCCDEQVFLTLCYIILCPHGVKQNAQNNYSNISINGIAQED